MLRWSNRGSHRSKREKGLLESEGRATRCQPLSKPSVVLAPGSSGSFDELRTQCASGRRRRILRQAQEGRREMRETARPRTLCRSLLTRCRPPSRVTLPIPVSSLTALTADYQRRRPGVVVADCSTGCDLSRACRTNDGTSSKQLRHPSDRKRECPGEAETGGHPYG
mgnify:CR=1 FL=1